MMIRDNQTWLADLSLDGPQRDAALTDLQQVLSRNLRKALSNSHRKDEALIEDSVQEALVRVLQKLDQFAGRSQFTTWATTIAIRVAMTELRRKRWLDVSLDDVLSDGAFPAERAVDAGAGPAQLVERSAVLEAMHRTIQFELTEKQRVVLMAELKGMPQDEIARHLNSNRNAVYKMGHDARKKLKQGLESAGYHAEDIHTAFAN